MRAVWLASSVVVFAFLGCSRHETGVRKDSPSPPASASAVKTAPEDPTSPPNDSSTALPSLPTSEAPHETSEAPHPTEAPEEKPKLVPFLSVVTSGIPSGAYSSVATTAKTYAPAGFDPLHAKPTLSWHLPGGSDVLAFEQIGDPNNFQYFVAVTNSGKLMKGYDTVEAYAVDPIGGHIALVHARPDAGGKRVWAQEIIDVPSGATSPLPRMSCLRDLSFVDGGARLFAQGWEYDAPEAPHAHICLFDTVGKLMVNVEAGLYNRHAAAADYINMTSGVLAKDPEVVWATREYEWGGNYDLTLLDTRPPYARKVARLPTPGQLGSTSNLEIDLADTTMGSTEVRYRGRSGAGWWWKWQTAELVDAP